MTTELFRILDFRPVPLDTIDSSINWYKDQVTIDQNEGIYDLIKKPKEDYTPADKTKLESHQWLDDNSFKNYFLTPLAKEWKDSSSSLKDLRNLLIVDAAKINSYKSTKIIADCLALHLIESYNLNRKENARIKIKDEIEKRVPIYHNLPLLVLATKTYVNKGSLSRSELIEIRQLNPYNLQALFHKQEYQSMMVVDENIKQVNDSLNKAVKEQKSLLEELESLGEELRREAKKLQVEKKRIQEKYNTDIETGINEKSKGLWIFRKETSTQTEASKTAEKEKKAALMKAESAAFQKAKKILENKTVRKNEKEVKLLEAFPALKAPVDEEFQSENTPHALLAELENIPLQIIANLNLIYLHLSELETYGESLPEDLPAWTQEYLEDGRPVRQKPALRDIGIAQVLDVEMKPKAYFVEEVSDVEIIRANESYEHEITNSIETFEDTEEETEESKSESENLSSEVSAEFSKDISKSTNEAIKAEAKLKVSAKYGTAKIQASAGGSYSRSQSEQENSSRNTAQKITKEAEKSFSQRQSKRIRKAITTRNIERHLFKREAAALSKTELNLWLKMRQEVQLRQFDTALTLVFDIPEPGIWLLHHLQSQNSHLKEPEIHRISLSSIDESEIELWQNRYPEISIPLAPKKFIYLTAQENSAQSEGADNFLENPDNKINFSSSIQFAKNMRIPAHYIPASLDVTCSGYYRESSSRKDWFECRSTFGGKYLGRLSGYGVQNENYDLTDLFREKDVNYAEGLDLAIHVLSARHKIAQINTKLLCKRTDAAMYEWKAEVLRIIKEAQLVRQEEYERQLSIAEMRGKDTTVFKERSPEENRRMMENELKKWCVQSMIGEPLGFNESEILVHNISYGSLNMPEPRFGQEMMGRNGLAYLMNEWFEWDAMTFFSDDYLAARRSTWANKLSLNYADKEFETFLKAGRASVYVPVARGSETKVLSFLQQLMNVHTPIAEIVNSYLSYVDSEDLETLPHIDLLNKVLRDKKKGFIPGPGSLSFDNADLSKAILSYSEEDFELTRWYPSMDDIGRIIEIRGVEYEIVDTNDEDLTLTLGRPYEGAIKENLSYRLKGVAIGEPFYIDLPTGFEINLTDAKLVLEKLNEMIAGSLPEAPPIPVAPALNEEE
ncbi:MAG: hypothetical protein R8P61_14540 [Bacteroidia bacterium]|nr:hypothetical protein [Bacteroidia bacterium]